MCSTSVHISTAMSSSDVHNQCSHIESYVEPDVHNQCSYIDSYVEPRSRQPVFTYRQLCSVPMCTTSVHNIDNFVQPQCAQPVFTNRQLCSAPMCITSVHISTTLFSPDVHNQCSQIDSYVQPRCAQPVFTYRQLCWAPMCTTSVHITAVPDCTIFSLTHTPRYEQPKRRTHTSRKLHTAQCNIRQCIQTTRHQLHIPARAFTN